MANRQARLVLTHEEREKTASGPDGARFRIEYSGHTRTRTQRLFRFIGAMIDPRAWVHLLKMVNYYNYAHVRPRRTMTVGQGSMISPTATFAYGHRIKLGKRVVVGENVRLWAGPEHARIVVGDDTIFGPNVLVTAANYRFNDGAPIHAQPMNAADIVIGSDVWVGGGATILAGVNIGDGAVIAAMCVVTRDVDIGEIVAGVPARVIGTRKPTS